MRRLVEIFVKFPFYANLVIFILLGAGVFSFLSMKKSFFPERETRNINIVVTYSGASPKEMEEGITVRVEEAIRGIAGIKEMNSVSSENSCRVVIETTGEIDIDETLQEVKNAVDGITSMPVDAERPIVYKVRSLTPAMRMGLSGSTDLMTLKKLAYQVEDDFLASGLMSQIDMSGFPATEISVDISQENLLRYGIKLSDVSDAINRNNRDVSGGQVKSEESIFIIRSRNRKVDPIAIENIIVRANGDGGVVRIGDLGKVTLQFEDVPNKAVMNGEPVISIGINKLITEDLESISIFVNEYVATFNAKHSAAQIHITFDFLDMLKSRLHLLYKNGGLGLLLVIVILALFLSLRLSLWVAWGIPSAFLAMFVVANLVGITINMISLFGMILVIGILVDDGIVIGENIFSHFEMGKSPMKAAVEGTMEVLPAVVTSVTTTIVAFIPLMLIEGRMSMMYEMAFVVVFSLLFSLLEAFFVLPAHVGTNHILKRKSTHDSFGNKFRNKLEYYISIMREKFYGRILAWLIQWRHVVMIVPIALLIITFGLIKGGVVSGTFFPNIPPDDFNVNIAFTPGEGEGQTFSFLKRFEKQIWEVNEDLKRDFNDTANFVVYTTIEVGKSFDGQESGTHAGRVVVNLRNMEGAPVSSFDIARRVRDKIGVVSEVDKLSVAGRNRWGSPVSISLLGNDLNQLKKARRFLMDELSQMPELTDIVDNNPLGAQEVLFTLKPKAYMLGLDQQSIMAQVRNGFFGAQSQRLQKGKDEIRVWVRYPQNDRALLGQLEMLKIQTSKGEFPLIELVDYKMERGPVGIHRFNGKREIRIEADQKDPYASTQPILENIEETVLSRLEFKYPGIRYEFQGQQKSAAETQREMQKYFIPAFLLIGIIIMIHFKSFGQGLIIISMIPLGWMGAIWGHMVHGLPLSILSAFGMVALSGVIVNDAVVFLQKFNDLVREGNKIKEAAYKAGIARFRAIVLTTLTTTIGLYPIILEQSRQAQYLIPMAIALAFGVLIGTGFILCFFPILILFLNDVRRAFSWLWNGGEKPSAESVEKANVYKNREIK